MRKIVITIIITFAFITAFPAKETKLVEISGKVMDFDNNPIVNASVEIKDTYFTTLYLTYTDGNGEYRLYVKEGTYLALSAVKDYGEKNLEYWAWNIPAYNDLEINAHVDGIEVYAMNAFWPQGGYPSLMIYFRPMSLKRVKEAGGIEALETKSLVEIAPNLSKKDIKLQINDRPIDILEVNRVQEAGGKDQSIIAYLIQCELPQNWRDSEYFRINIILNDTETKEWGEGCIFWKNIFWKKNNDSA